MKNYRKFIIPIAVIGLLTILVAWKLSANKNAMEKDAAVATIQTSVFPVTVVQPELKTLSQSASENGIFQPYKELNLLSETSGRITALKVKKGQYVGVGTVLASLDNKQILIDLDLAKKTLAKNKLDMEKYQDMLSKNAVNGQQIEDQKLTISNAESRVASLNRQLQTATITAPISGIINELKIEVGSYLSPGAPIADIVNIGSLKMNVLLLDKDVARVNIGQIISITSDLYPTQIQKGTVSAIAAVGDAARKFEVEITLPNNSKTPLKAGMTGKAEFTFGKSKEAITIPASCLVGSVQDAKVYTVVDNRVVSKSIVVGNSDGENLEIISGLSTSDIVVSSGQINITDSSAVSIIK